MDLSKLPRLSKTDAPPPSPDASDVAADPDGPAPPPAAATATFCNRCGAPLRPGARFCDSCGAGTGIGSDYAAAPVRAEPGVEAAVLALVNTRFRAKVALVMFALFITVLATLYNIVVAVKLLTVNTLPITSLLAVAFGGYIAVYEWRLLQQLRLARR